MGSKRKTLNYKAIGDWIRYYRQRADLPQEIMAERVGVSVPHYSNIERGKTATTLPVLVSIADTLDIDTGLLLQDVVKHAKPALMEEAANLFDDATEYETKMLLALLKQQKAFMRQYAFLQENKTAADKPQI